MKRYKTIIGSVLLVAFLMLAGACGLVSSYDYAAYPNIHLEEAVHLTEDAASPYCDFSLDYAYLDEEGDSIAALINRTIQHEFLGEVYASLTPSVAVDSFKNDYLRAYRQETEPLFKTDVAQNGNTGEWPAWYNQTYSMVSLVEDGYNGIVNVSSNVYCDMGGAHPNQWGRWLNFDGSTGKLLTLQDVFPADAKMSIERMLLDKLIEHQATQYPDETIASLNDLHNKGILQLTEMYIPDNFLLAKDEMLFLFNRYDIAPYSAGEIVLRFGYEEIGPYLKLN